MTAQSWPTRQDLIALIDYTRLKPEDSEQDILDFCEQRQAQAVAAICVYPRFIPTVKSQIENTAIKIASVVNFPDGCQPIETVQADILSAIELGADEIDVVMPYPRYLAGEREAVIAFIQACKQACGEVCMKVILETGALESLEVIKVASEDMITAGADFLKTSTGFNYPGASLAAAKIMLSAIADSGKAIGFKASGGIQTEQDARAYCQLAKEIMGQNWVTQSHFRLGASRLLAVLI